MNTLRMPGPRAVWPAGASRQNGAHLLPPPVRLVYRLPLNIRYDARHLWGSEADRADMAAPTGSRLGSGGGAGSRTMKTTNPRAAGRLPNIGASHVAARAGGLLTEHSQ